MPIDVSRLKYEDHIGLWADELKEWLPDTIFDAHVHLGLPEVIGNLVDERLKEPLATFTSLTWEDASAWYRQLYNGKTIAGLIAFGFPLREVNLEAANEYIVRLMQTNQKIKGFLISDPQNTQKTIVQFNLAIKRGMRFSGIKPYYDLLGKSNYKTSMPEFIPRDLLEFMDKEKLIMMLHTSGIGMGDTANQNFVKSVTAYFPNIKIILAHMGRYLEVQQFYDFLESNVLDNPNVYLEISSASKVQVYEAVLEHKELWNRLIFGSDIPFGLITGQEYYSKETGPVFLTRDKYTWSNIELDKKFGDIRPSLTYNTYHTIKAVKTAIEKLNLTESNVVRLKNMIFLDNARSLFLTDSSVLQ